jgi:hypothetical protein
MLSKSCSTFQLIITYILYYCTIKINCHPLDSLKYQKINILSIQWLKLFDCPIRSALIVLIIKKVIMLKVTDSDFTFIGGLFVFWFGVSLKNLFELFLKNFKALKSYTKIVLKFLQLLIIKMFEKILLILIWMTYYIYSLINNLFVIFKNYINYFRNPQFT